MIDGLAEFDEERLVVELLAVLVAQVEGVDHRVAERHDLGSDVLAALELTGDFDPDEILEEVDEQFVETIYLLVG